MMPESTKYCRACSNWLDVAKFSRAKANKDGLASYCKSCISIRNRDHYSKTRGTRLVDAAHYRAENPTVVRQRTKQWRENNHIKISEYGKQNRENIYRHGDAYRKRHPERLRSRYAKRRASMQMPVWADEVAIKAIYKMAANLTVKTGTPHEVDHIVPLASELVCGLHCEANLRIIPRAENRQKSNRFWPDMP